MSAFRIPSWLRAHALALYRVATGLVLAAGTVLVVVSLAARYWLLPDIDEHRDRIIAALSKAAHQRISIGHIAGRWQGLHPVLVFDDVTVYDAADRPALTLARTENAVSWWSLPAFELRLASIEIERPELRVKRDRDGRVHVAGIESASDDAGGWSDWILRQGSVVVRDAAITWQDDMREAPALALAHVDFRLENSGRRHRFGLRAEPPSALAAPLDVRGDLRGESLADPLHWSGRLFARLDYVDIAAWRTWIPFPVSFPHGTGAARLWANFADGGVIGFTADAELSNVRTRLGHDLPELELSLLQGRIAWKLQGEGFDCTTNHLVVSTHEGWTLPSTDFSLEYRKADGHDPERGMLRANRLDIVPLLALADRLPVDAALREEFSQYAPHGGFEDVALDWSGAWPHPERYKVKARFSGLGLNPVGRLPGFSGVSGQVDGTEKGGTLYLGMQNATAQLPLVFRDTVLLDSLAAKVAWTHSGEQYEVDLNDVSFSNADLAGTISGSYRTAAQGRGSADLTGRLMRADARQVHQYIPLVVGEQGRHWLDRAFLAGDAKDVAFRLKGDLDHFPFTNGKDGEFRVAIKVTGATLDYADGWPPIENIAGDVVFSGSSVQINAREGQIYGVRLSGVKAEIPDLHHDQRRVNLEGGGDGPTADFLRYIASSPLNERLGTFASDIDAQGRGKLSLRMMLPLHEGEHSTVAGSYQILDNRLATSEGLVLDNANGTLEFTESSARAARIGGRFLGGTAAIAVASGHDGTRITAQGRADFDAYKRGTSDFPWEGLQKLAGTADWKADIRMHDGQDDALIESALRGTASALPAPFAKAAADTLPLRLERHVLNADQQRYVLGLGKLVSAQWMQQREDGRWQVRRGNMSFGGAAPLRDRGGLAINGSVDRLDLDGWLALLHSGVARDDTQGLSLRNVSGIDLKLGELHMFDRTLHDVAVAGSGSRQAAGALQLTLNGAEIAGDVNWNPQDKGRLQARLSRLTLPAAETAAAARPDTPGQDGYELPALDISVDNFTWVDKALGRLEIGAHPDGDDWRIDKLKVANPDATLQAKGAWESWRSQPHTEISFKLEAEHIDKLLKRMNQPASIKGGNGTVDGDLAWVGAPYEFDERKVSGHVNMEAHKGQFAKLDPGVGRLLGLLSLQSLPRRITLDFRDIFSEGLAFDEITGSVKITRGLASTENLRIQGPSARVMMSGEVDLAAETQRLRVRVIPKISDSVSAAVGLATGPIGAAAVFVASKLFKDPLDQMIARDYELTGSWSNPKVNKVETQAAGVESAPAPTP